jgi:hypothetical protein
VGGERGATDRSSRLVRRIIAAAIGLVAMPFALYAAGSGGTKLIQFTVARADPTLAMGVIGPSLGLVAIGVVLVVLVAATAYLSALGPLVGSLWCLPAAVLAFLPSSLSSDALVAVSRAGVTVVYLQDFLIVGPVLIGWTLFGIGLRVFVRRRWRMRRPDGVLGGAVGTLIAVVSAAVSIVLVTIAFGQGIIRAATLLAPTALNPVSVASPFLFVLAFLLWLLAVASSLFSRWPAVVLGVLVTLTGVVGAVFGVELLSGLPSDDVFPAATLIYNGVLAAVGLSLVATAFAPRPTLEV